MHLTDTFETVPAGSTDLARTVIDTYENLDPTNLDHLRKIYAQDVCFEDPVHGVQGLDALEAYFNKSFANVIECRFKFHRTVVSSEGLFFSWTMMLRHKTIRRGQLIRVEGSSYLKHRDGRVYYHRDYFDLGAMVYENIPVIGALIRHIRRRLVP